MDGENNNQTEQFDTSDSTLRERFMLRFSAFFKDERSISIIVYEFLNQSDYIPDGLRENPALSLATCSLVLSTIFFLYAEQYPPHEYSASAFLAITCTILAIRFAMYATKRLEL